MGKVSTIRPLLKGESYYPCLAGSDCFGTYRWWFHESCLKHLGLSLGYPQTLLSTDFQGEKYYALYFGIAAKETIRQRLHWHINQKHTQSSFKSGYISTLRLTLCALLLNPASKPTLKQSEDVVNDFMDKYCVVEWCSYHNNAEDQIRADEKAELRSYCYPLNIQGNKWNLTDLMSKREKIKSFLASCSI